MTFRQPKLLSDEPATEDSLGTHERIATALAALIDTSEGGKSIRLDGDWGTGKSTVIQILKRLLSKDQTPQHEKNPATWMFVYDVWVHSGDGLRRAFFESLVKDLLACGWIRPESDSERNWKQKLVTMAGKSRRVTKLSWPQLTWRSRLVLALGVTCALLAPAAYSLLAKMLQDLPTPQLWWLIGLSAAVLFSLVLGASAPDLRVLLTRSTLDETTETLTDPEPTSIEFQEEFERLMMDVLNPREHPKRKLVIVVDNLDRIEFDEAKQVWTLLRSFLDNPVFRESKWFKRLWLLVPIANESHFSKLASTNEANPAQGSTNILEKVFQVRMSLPLPMLRSWKDFLAQKLEDCFGADVDGSYEVIARLLHSITAGAAPTPRKLIVFVNELVALFTERQGDMPLSTLAAYILSRDLTRTQPWQVPVELANVLYSPAIEQDFATLFLHAEKSADSLYLLIMPNLTRALEMGSPDELSKILHATPAAQDILDRHLIERFSRMSQSTEEAQREQVIFFAFLRALAMFTDSELSDGIPTNFLAHIRPRIDEIMKRLQSLDLSNPSIADGVSAYLKLTNDSTVAAPTVNRLLHQISAIPEANSSIAAAAWDNWTRSLVELLSVEEVHACIDIMAGQRILLPAPIERWAIICAGLEADTSPGFILDMIDISTDDDKLADWIASESLPMHIDNRAGTVLQQGLRARGSGFFDLVTRKIGAIIRTRADLPRSEIIVCLTYLLEVSNEYTRPFLKELANEGKFVSWSMNDPKGGSIILDENFIRLSLLYIWTQDGLTKNFPNKSIALMFTNSIAGLFKGMSSTSSIAAKVSAEFIARTKIYDVLPIIASISSGSNEILEMIISGLCDDADFLSAARMELYGNLDSSELSLLIGQGADVVRNLLAQVIKPVESPSSPSSEQTDI
ncbi:hypothetical protein CY652_07835 [Burkholderia sp. WAC0059]|uniref:P-loop NTPase fold protein n=1 Tax=Burkholderia sp. WAC0059 TaxID=2066022 RepID=UPI000C7EF042|nr:P-loop NTPase fold protein [Burkholderia sp. WAC0059]PLZ02827.1 hypothetical protein CY652_07835 [Burkholderia sp. WAC0059]